MKLLLDENISFRASSQLRESFLIVNHVSDFGLERASDWTVRKYAKDHGFTIVTFDSDFCDLLTLHGHPPLVIWLRTGNSSTRRTVDLLKSRAELIHDFTTQPQFAELGCLELLG